MCCYSEEKTTLKHVYCKLIILNFLIFKNFSYLTNLSFSFLLINLHTKRPLVYLGQNKMTNQMNNIFENVPQIDKLNL